MITNADDVPAQMEDMHNFVLNCVMGRARCEDTPAANPVMFQDRRFGLCYTFGGQFDYVLYDWVSETKTLRTVINWQNGELHDFCVKLIRLRQRGLHEPGQRRLVGDRRSGYSVWTAADARPADEYLQWGAGRLGRRPDCRTQSETGGTSTKSTKTTNFSSPSLTRTASTCRRAPRRTSPWESLK